MLHLSIQGLQDRAAWAQASIRLPHYDVATVRARAQEAPVRLRFDTGNILRKFLAATQQTLLNTGRADIGILAAESFDFQITDQVHSPHDALSLLVRMCVDDSEEREVIVSATGGLKADCAGPDWTRLTQVFCSPALQMVSFTITEKGYALTDLERKPLPMVGRDLAAGPEGPRHTMSIAATLPYRCFQAGGAPIAMVSVGNCACNGGKLRTGVLSIARGWAERGPVEFVFLDQLEDEGRMSSPWSMTDKTAPYPSERVQEELGRLGVVDMATAHINTSTLIAPFVNAEIMEYLVLEDTLPNGHPVLEGAGVYPTDRTTVKKAEEVEVGACLNPLYTALTVYDCLPGYTSIAAEAKDADLKTLMEHIAAESPPVMEDSGILNPRIFIDEVLYKQFPNPIIPDTPQRTTVDTSQKLPVRYGGTLRRYTRQSE